MARRNSPVREVAAGDRDARRPDLARSRLEPERRTKPHQDRPSSSNYKGKGKARHSKVASKKRRVVRPGDSDSSAEEIADADPDWRYDAFLRVHSSRTVRDDRSAARSLLFFLAVKLKWTS